MNPFIKLFPSPSFVEVLAIFLSHPKEELYQSYIVESTGCALIQVQRALKRIEETGLINKTKSGNRFYYKANEKHPAFENIKQALFKTVLFGDLLKNALKTMKKKIQFCFIYGSLAIGSESYSSDIDLFIMGDLGLRDIAHILSEIGNDLKREINPTVYSEKELKKKIKEKNPFIKEIMRSPKIWLIGDEYDFKKMDQ
jgi:uncharacterized protein